MSRCRCCKSCAYACHHSVALLLFKLFAYPDISHLLFPFFFQLPRVRLNMSFCRTWIWCCFASTSVTRSSRTDALCATKSPAKRRSAPLTTSRLKVSRYASMRKFPRLRYLDHLQLVIISGFRFAKYRRDSACPFSLAF